MTLIIRSAQQQDAVQAATVLCESIRQLCVADHCNDDETVAAWTANKTPDNFQKWLVNPELFNVVAEVDGKVLGVGMISNSGEVRLLYVSPKARFKGVSTALLARLEEYAKGQGIEETNLDSSKTASTFYESRGYRPCGEPVQGFGKTWAFPMKKRLPL